LIDGLPVIPFPLPQTAIIDGDCISLSIAAASVIAKVTRDRIMRDFCTQFPQYCFGQHKGYGTDLHLLNSMNSGLVRSIADLSNRWRSRFSLSEISPQPQHLRRGAHGEKLASRFLRGRGYKNSLS
jgi:ribonuclease HII